MTFKLLLLVTLIGFTFAEDLLGGLEHSSEMGTTRKLDAVELKELNSSDFNHEALSKAIKDAQKLKLIQLQHKIQLLDEAHLLPKRRSEKYKQQQKELQEFRNELAHRMVESHSELESRISHTQVVDIPTEYLHLSAARILKTIPEGQQREEFKSNWKASIVDRGARTSFGTMLAMINLYGIEHKLVKSFNQSLSAYRDSFEKVHTEYSGEIPKQERTDLIYRIFQNSNLVLDKPLQMKLNKIALMESKLNNKNHSLKARKLALRKLEFEKEAFLNLLISDGLNLTADESLSIEQIEQSIENWFDKNALDPEILVWPFDEPVEILSTMNLPNQSYCAVKTINSHAVRAPADAKIIQNSSQRIIILSMQHWIMFEGAFKSSLAKTSKVSATQIIAMNEPPYEVRVTLQNMAQKKTWKDICELR